MATDAAGPTHSQPTSFHYYRGRVALSAILSCMEVSPGDEVIVQAYTCVAVPNPLLRLGLRPVYVDIDRRTLTMNTDHLRQALSPRTRAVVVQHTFGAPADLRAVLETTRQSGVAVIEDCAHVLAGSVGGQPLGTVGVASFYSHEWGKPVVAGVGGTAVVNDEFLARRLRERYPSFTAPPLRREVVMLLQYLAHRAVSGTSLFWQLRSLYGRLSRSGVIVGSYDADPRTSPEYGWRMTRAVRGRLARCEEAARERLDWRRRIEARYWAGLAELGIARLVVPANSASVLMRVPVTVASKGLVLEAAKRQGLELGGWYATAVHPLAEADLPSVGIQPGQCPEAEWAARHVVTLPVRGTTTLAQVDRALDLFARLRGEGRA